MSDENTHGDTPIDIFATPELALARQKLDEAAARHTATVTYVSAGHCLVIGEPDAALDAAERLLAAGLEGVTAVHVDGDAARVSKALTERGTAFFTAPALHLDGHLGAFVASGLPASGHLASDPASPADTSPSGAPLDLAISVRRPGGHFDLVLDLSPVPTLAARLPPPGYVHVAAMSPEALDGAIETLAGLVGEFDKPRYFAYDASICAHSRSRLSGCSNCLDVCAAGAIRSDGEGVTIDPWLCQGCGSCATVCPSGAMVYAYPKPSEAIRRSREALAGSTATTLLLHDERVQASVDAALPPGGEVLPLLVEEVSAFGIDYWVTMLCAGIGRVLLVSDAPDPDRQTLEGQAVLLRTLIDGLGVGPEAVQVIPSTALADLATLPPPAAALVSLSPAAGDGRGALGVRPPAFATHDDKRQTVRGALDALAAALGPAAHAEDEGTGVVPLPAGSPFGRIAVDTDACTLCMACVSTCPAGALLDGQDTPALRLIEASCVQCGLCEKACPEAAISLEPRYLRDSVAARRVETLHEEAPFHCVTCHKPFATRRIIETMLGKLAEHRMFQGERARRRLKMCEDCRVRDIFGEGGEGLDVHGDGQPVREGDVS